MTSRLPDGAVSIERVDSTLLCDAGVTSPVVFAGERNTYLKFNLASDDDIGIIRFEHCIVSKLGYPNDEALPGHSLYQFGLTHYELQLVINSPWLRELNLANEISFPESLGHLDGYKHFIFPFHDSTFECLADSFQERKVAHLNFATIQELKHLFEN